MFTTNYLKTFQNVSKSKLVLKAVIQYALEIRCCLINKLFDEKKFVQPKMGVLLEKIKTLLSCKTNVKDERRYTLRLENTESITIIDGFSDHTIKIASCDAHVLAVEDKAVDESFTNESKAQIQSHMIYELSELKKLDNYSPDEYCGILQNGVSWLVFIRRRKVSSNKYLWNYVELPSIIENNHISVENCRLLTRYLEHCLFVAEKISSDIIYPRNRIGVTSLPSIQEHSSDDNNNDNNEEDNEDNGTDPDNENLTMNDLLEALDDIGQSQENGNPSSNVPQRKRTTSTNEHRFYFSAKENIINYEALSAENLKTLPALFYRPFI
jgi:hypothetical protein